MKQLVIVCYLICYVVLNNGFAQDKITLVEVASGFNTPVGLVHVGDARLFIVEKDGYIKIMDTTGQVLPDPFLNIDGKVNSVASERGLLGLAFHPGYPDNGFFFVNYTNSGGHTVVARYVRDSLDSNLGDPMSETILMTVTQPYNNHNGGHLAFGPDGYLYIGLGDGGNAGDPGDRAQNGQERLGKMMRIDVDGALPFAIPPDNPFIGNDTILEEIWALGLRNPWRYSFDRLTGDLWIADVGQGAWEEVDFQPFGNAGGQNYGWRCKEGLQNYNTSGCPSPDVFTDPVYVYGHSGLCGGSVTGGFVYRGSRNPYLFGKYVFTDYCNGIFRSIVIDGEGNVEAEELANLQDQQFTSFGEDASGELYVAAINGTIYRVEDLISAVDDPDRTGEVIYPNPV
ncbi:MAG TPA: PQQ-dependent sugar dehydrogenase, partial [Saprospiraceae bacterium]|nr:PQQ-dependent sugar dehydrogenase [Saprospiraceae bacterium]